ncbi:MAG: ribonuclease E activity regulator RraA [Pseudomonadota bacterium]
MHPAFATTDLCDHHEDQFSDGRLQVLPPLYGTFGKRIRFAGPARTIQVFEDNVLVRAALEQAGDGHVLVVDGGGSLRCALVGGKLAVLAQDNGWAGIIVHGCIRDVDEINACDIGVRALAVHPKRSVRKGVGEVDVVVTIADVTIRPGDWIYADADGVLVAQKALIW